MGLERVLKLRDWLGLLGSDLDRDALARMASGADRFYLAPDAEDLAAIYRRIAVTLPCPAGAFWGRR